MQIPQSVIDEVNQRADLVEVIGKHLKLKRSGQNYFACCPFHNEKSPSFSISPVKQMYHCFGCGESGNAVSFVMKYQGLDFVSAIQSLAEQYGVNIPADERQEKISREEQQKRKEHKLNIYQTLEKACLYYRQQLSQSSVALHYLREQRGLSNEIINKFSLGYTPAGFNNLQQTFPDYPVNKLLVDAGLVVVNDNNKRYDRFRERVIFPIRNIKGEIIGFGGRIITKGEPKYLNSPETELFNKSQELYGLYEAKKDIRDLNQVFVVEGYMDVIALNQYGINNVVATMGTAATEEHIKTMFRFCDNICYSFDGDNAGKKAAWRALERSIGLVTDIKSVNFLFLPEEHDPDSYIREHGRDTFKNLAAKHSTGLITFLLNQLVEEVNIATDEGKARLISLVKPYTEQIKAIALQVILKKQLATMVDLDPSVVESILNNRSRFAFYNKSLKNISNAYQNNLKRQPLNLNLLENIIQALFNQPLLAREFPLPEIHILETKDLDLSELFILIAYLESHCDSFDDIVITDLKMMTNFAHINLLSIYQKVKTERENFTNTFTFSKEDYCKKLHELVYEKKRPRMPKLT